MGRKKRAPFIKGTQNGSAAMENSKRFIRLSGSKEKGGTKKTMFLQNIHHKIHTASILYVPSSFMQME